MKKWIAIMIGLLVIDQLTKYLVASNEANFAIIQDVLHVTYIRNHGLVFGFFQGATSTHRTLLAILAFISLVIFSYLFSRINFKDKRTIWLSLSISLLIAGTLGNAIDRLFQPDHGVIDFIDFRGFGRLWTYIFNFADVYLNIGLALFFIDVFFLEKKRVETNDRSNA